ncbi:hypothetical protein FHS96_001193 [Sphingomonas zeicaulis]|uniref:tetratricopeptide repeat protein n=1 Tax=Sphingomonas zeicaulis TaxID=1632740 RepID=UPI003D22B1B2
MALLVASMLLQVLCAVHAVRTGRGQMWLFIILLFSVIGCVVYFFAEVLPDMRGNRHVRTARGAAMAKLDPERDLREAQGRLDVADTIANRVALADALAVLGRHGEAVAAYREALAMMPMDHPRVQTRLARSLFESGDSRSALAVIEALPEAAGTGEGDQRLLLKARILAEIGRSAEALSLYADIVNRVPGEEARCRYAALLLETGDRMQARSVLEEVERRARRLDRTQRFAERDMYDWAERELKALRG